MEVRVARFTCIHPNCTEKQKEADYSLQTIYEHIGQHLFQDTGIADHFNMRCTCGSKMNFALQPYATAHLDQMRDQMATHKIVCCPVTIGDIESSKRMIAYQKRFIQFKGYKVEADIYPNMGRFPEKDINTPLHQVISALGLGQAPFPFPFDPYGNHQQNFGVENAHREMSPVNVRTPAYRQSPSPPVRREGSRSVALCDSGRSSGGYGRRSPPEPYRNRRSSSPTPLKGRYDRDSDMGRSFGRESDRDRRSFGRDYSRDDRSELAGYGRGRRFGGDRGGYGRGRGFGRGSVENGSESRFRGRNIDATNSRMNSNGDSNVSEAKPNFARKRIRDGMSPRSSDEESQKGEPDAHRSGNPTNEDEIGNSAFGAGTFSGGKQKDDANGGPSQPDRGNAQMQGNQKFGDRTTPRSSDDEP